MAAHPEPFDIMSGGERIEAAPQILIFHRFSRGGAPAIALPAMHPAGDAVTDIGRIGINSHAAAAFQRFERHDRRCQLHPVIGRRRLATRKGLLRIAGAQQNAPAARARISAAGAVGIGDHQAGRSSNLGQRGLRFLQDAWQFENDILAGDDNFFFAQNEALVQRVHQFFHQFFRGGGAGSDAEHAHAFHQRPVEIGRFV